MTGGVRLGRARRAAPALAVAAIAGVASGSPPAAGRVPQAGGSPQVQTSAPRVEDGTAGRRDPFLPAPEGTAAPRRAVQRARGLAGLRVGEVTVVGIVSAVGARLAVLEAPDGRTYVTRVNDRLADALVREVARDSVLFLLTSADGREGAAAGRARRRGLGDRPDGP